MAAAVQGSEDALLEEFAAISKVFNTILVLEETCVIYCGFCVRAPSAREEFYLDIT